MIFVSLSSFLKAIVLAVNEGEVQHIKTEDSRNGVESDSDIHLTLLVPIIVLNSEFFHPLSLVFFEKHNEWHRNDEVNEQPGEDNDDSFERQVESWVGF